MLKLFLISVFVSTSIYSVHFNNIDGNDQSFSFCQGKKILIVNIATGSQRVNQLAGLQQLQEQYSDSLVIVAFPSNSFGHESRSNSEIKTFCQSQYNVSFVLGEKGNVTGENKLAIYNWLTSVSDNGVMNSVVSGDFQKFLVDKNGSLIGVFGPVVEPADSMLVQAITGN